MDNKENNISEIMKRLTPVNPKDLEDFKRAMNDEIIPEILRVTEERCILAAESRQGRLTR